MMEGIGQFALTLKKDFNPFLLKTMHLLLEYAGNQQSLVSLSGMLAINNIRSALNYENVTELFKENADYLRYHIIRKLKHLERNVEVMDMLAVIMNHCTIDLLPLLQEIVNDVLLKSCDKFQYNNSFLFLKIFHEFIVCVSRWQINNPSLPNKDPEQEKLKHESEVIQNQVDELRNIVNEYDEISKELDNNSKTLTEMLAEDLKEEEKRNRDEMFDIKEEEINNPKATVEIQLTADIMKRCLNFLPSKDTNCKLLCIDTLIKGVEIISEWEDLLLPITHLIWRPLVDRFKEMSQPLIIHRSLLLLLNLARYTKDFIRRRADEKVIPILFQYLNDLASQSYLKDRGSSYRYTQEYKLQLAILTHVPGILIYLDVKKETFLNAAKCGIIYLDKNQPILLQNTCCEYHSKLLKTKCSSDLQKIYNEYIKNSNYKKNIELILKDIKDF